MIVLACAEFAGPLCLRCNRALVLWPSFAWSMPKRHCCYCGRDVLRSHATRRGPSAATLNERIRACHYRAYAGIRSTSIALYLCHTHRSTKRPALSMQGCTFDEDAFLQALIATQLVTEEQRVRAWREESNGTIVVPTSATAAAAPAASASTAATNLPALAALPAPAPASSSSTPAVALPLPGPLPLPGLERLLAEVSQQTHQTSSQLSTTARAWMRDTDFHNNYGGDFINVQADPSFLALSRLMATSSEHQQSGVGSDHSSVAAQLWEQLNVSCGDLFGGYTAISVAMHTSDLLPHIACLHHVRSADEARRKEMADISLPELPLVPDRNARIGVLSLPRSYFEMGFVMQSFTMRSGRYLPMTTTDTDPSFPYGSLPPQDLQERESAALQEIKAIIVASRKAVKESSIEIFVLEPLLVPGYGHTYRPDFMLRLQSVLQELGVLLVADESLSFVRCGAALFSHTISGFTPDLVIVGKGIGCSLLLLRDALPGADYVRVIFERAFSLIASPLTLLQACCALRVMSEGNVASRCKQQGAAILQQLQQLPGVKSRGVGLCLWVDDGLHQLPIAACIHGRLLPRLEQTADTLKAILRTEQEVTAACKTAGELEAIRIPSCAVCGDQCRSDEDCHDCAHCTRQYHLECVRRPRAQKQPLRHCPCGSDFGR